MGLTIRRAVNKTHAVTLSVEGKINNETAGTLDQEIQQLLQSGMKSIVLDMVGVDFVSSAGIGVLLKAKASLTRSGGDLFMLNLQPQIQKAFDIMKLLPAMNVFASVQELDNYLAKVQQKIVEEGTSFGEE